MEAVKFRFPLKIVHCAFLLSLEFCAVSEQCRCVLGICAIVTPKAIKNLHVFYY